MKQLEVFDLQWLCSTTDVILLDGQMGDMELEEEGVRVHLCLAYLGLNNQVCECGIRVFMQSIHRYYISM